MNTPWLQREFKDFDETDNSVTVKFLKDGCKITTKMSKERISVFVQKYPTKHSSEYLKKHSSAHKHYNLVDSIC